MSIHVGKGFWIVHAEGQLDIKKGEKFMLRLRKKQSHVDSIEAYTCYCQTVYCPCECGMCDVYTLYATFQRAQNSNTSYAEYNYVKVH
jgi:hypothetical protein